MAQVLVEPMARLVNQLSRLPGVGAKSAQRLAYHIIDMGEGEVRELAEAIFYAKKRTHFCSQCGNLTDGIPAPFAGTTGGTGAWSAWLRIPGISWPWSGCGIIRGYTTCSTAPSPPWMAWARIS